MLRDCGSKPTNYYPADIINGQDRGATASVIESTLGAVDNPYKQILKASVLVTSFECSNNLSASAQLFVLQATGSDARAWVRARRYMHVPSQGPLIK